MSRQITVSLPDIPAAQKAGTSALPDHVVTQDLAIGIWAVGSPENPNPRAALQFFSIRIGKRENPKPPDISPDEVEYVAKVIEHAASLVRQRFRRLPPE